MKVTATLQAPNNSPVPVVWASDTDGLGVIQCITQLLTQDKDESPWSPRVLDIHIEL